MAPNLHEVNNYLLNGMQIGERPDGHACFLSAQGAVAHQKAAQPEKRGALQ
jgi:hypothetical protein